jgi:hypothetical protein
VESYNETIENLKKSSSSKTILQEEAKLENNEIINKITDTALYDLIIELLLTESNVFLYGYGSKLRLIYNFIKYFQDTVNCGEDGNYHLLIFNCYNPEINMKFMLNEITAYIWCILDTSGKGVSEVIKKVRTTEDHIVYISELLKEIERREINAKFLLIVNNVDGPNFQSKPIQSVLANLVSCSNILLLATSDNLYVNYFWTQSIKDSYSFYFLKFHTFTPYELEINDKNSLIGEKTIKSGNGLAEIFRSLTKNQREVLKHIADIQLKGNLDILTAKGLVDYLSDNAYGVCNSQNRLMELIHEPIYHEILVERIHKNTKQIYKLNLEIDVIERIKNGEYNFEDEI